MRAVVLAGLVLGTLGACTAADPTSTEQAIVDGTLDNGDPAVYFMYRRDGASCTAELISPHVVLTARHCVVGSDDGPAPAAWFSLSVGRSYGRFYNTYRVSSVHIIPGSHGGVGLRSADDLGLLVLTTAAVETPLFIERDPPDSLAGQIITAIGFGQVPSGGSGTKLRTMKRVERLQNGLIFVEPTVCPGDSGGPLIGPNGHVYGVASFISPAMGTTTPVCGTAPGAYNSIFRHLGWIDSVLEAAGDLCVVETEVCDGVDNSCDGVVDEGCLALGETCVDSSECVGGLCDDVHGGRICTQRCDATLPLDGCAPGLHCIVSTGCEGRCVLGVPGSLGIGATCSDAASCESGNCLDPGDGRQRCLPLCRGDEGFCGSAEVCTGGPGACGACVPSEIFREPRGLGEECGGSSCRSPAVCVQRAGIGECAAPCMAGETCTDGFICQFGNCVLDRRQPPGGACVEPSDCLAGTCAAQNGRGWCSPLDCTAVPCPAGFECIPLAGAQICAPMLAVVGDPCVLAADCASALCVSGVCSTECDSANDCGAGLRCLRTSDGHGGFCVRPPPRPSGCAVLAPGEGSGFSPAVFLICLCFAVSAARVRRARTRGHAPRP